MKKIEAILRPEKIEEMKELLESFGVRGMTVTMVSGCGNQKGRKKVYRGTEFSLNLLPKIKVETVVSDELAPKLIDAVVKTMQTGEIGDGKIFVFTVEQAVRIRTGESGEDAI